MEHLQIKHLVGFIVSKCPTDINLQNLGTICSGTVVYYFSSILIIFTKNCNPSKSSNTGKYQWTLQGSLWMTGKSLNDLTFWPSRKVIVRFRSISIPIEVFS